MIFITLVCIFLDVCYHVNLVKHEIEKKPYLSVTRKWYHFFKHPITDTGQQAMMGDWDTLPNESRTQMYF